MSHAFATVAATMPGPESRRVNLARLGDRFTRLLCKGAALGIVALSILLLITLIWYAWLSIHTNGFAFFTSKTWAPQETQQIFGSLAFVYGTLASSALAMLIAVPLGVGTAAFLAEIAPAWLRRPGSFLVEMLAAVPSV